MREWHWQDTKPTQGKFFCQNDQFMKEMVKSTIMTLIMACRISSLLCCVTLYNMFVCFRERMEAMEKQIASLTGLVQSVLTRAPDSP